jgi:hypothetical protein
MERESIAKILLYLRSRWSIHNLEPATAEKKVVSLPLPTIPLSFPQLLALVTFESGGAPKWQWLMTHKVGPASLRR